MGWLLGLGASALALADAWILIGIPQPIWFTILWGLATAGAGWWLQRRENLDLWPELESAVQNGRVPAEEAIDAMLAVLGGWALILPGWLTDCAGGIMIVPLARKLAIPLIRNAIRDHIAMRASRGPSPATGEDEARADKADQQKAEQHKTD